MPKMTFIDPEGIRHEVDALVGATVLKIARSGNIDLDGAAW